MAKKCLHLSQINEVAPSADGCEKCLKAGDMWVELRVCLTCGHVGCCDSSKNKHARAHFNETKHPIIKAFKSFGEWKWCYIDKVYLA